MKRRTMILAAVAALGSAGFAQASEALLNAGAGTPVLSSDGANVGLIRSRGRMANGRIRLFVRRTRGSLFRRIDEDVLIDLDAEDASIQSGAIVLGATAQTLRQRLQYNSRVDSSGRIRL